MAQQSCAAARKTRPTCSQGTARSRKRRRGGALRLPQHVCGAGTVEANKSRPTCSQAGSGGGAGRCGYPNTFAARHRGGQEVEAHLQSSRQRRRGGALWLPQHVCGAGTVEDNKSRPHCSQAGSGGGAGRCGYPTTFAARAPWRARSRGPPTVKQAAAAGRGAAATPTRLRRGHRRCQLAEAHLQPRHGEKQAAAAGRGAAATPTLVYGIKKQERTPIPTSHPPPLCNRE
jgi:hypothetical protein